MKITEILQNTQEPQFSFEVIPPVFGDVVSQVLKSIESLKSIKPAWINVTNHSMKASKTLEICESIQARFKVDAVAHLLCQGSTGAETESKLKELQYRKIKNILALQGDGSPFPTDAHLFASDLVQQVKKYSNKFCVGVAGYPEKHSESPDTKTDLEFLKEKVDAGADYILTQFFFDNQKYFEFVKNCREVGIKVPIIPALKLISGPEQVLAVPKRFRVSLPQVLTRQILDNPKATVEIGINWALLQAEELMNLGVPGVHFFVANNASPILEICRNLRKTL